MQIVLGNSRLPFYFDLKEEDIEGLRRAGLIEPEAVIVAPPKKVDYNALAEEYRRFLDSARYPNRSAMARDLKVSRAWIHKVMTRGLHEAVQQDQSVA